MRSRQWAALAWFAVGGLASAVHAQDVPGQGGPAAVPSAPGAVTTPGAPPLWVAGVAIAPAQRTAVLVLLDDARREKGIISLREGESFGGYRVLSVEPDRVSIEHGGAVFSVPVGRPYTGLRAAPDSGPPAPRRFFFVPADKPAPDPGNPGSPVWSGGGSAASGVAGAEPPSPQAIENLLERVFSHPMMQQRLDEMRPRLQQGRERARRDGEGSAEPSAPTPKPGE